MPAATDEARFLRAEEDTVKEHSLEVRARRRRVRALAKLGAMADRGDFDEFVGNPTAYWL